MSVVLDRLARFWEPLKLGEDVNHVNHRLLREQRIYDLLDLIGFNHRVYWVATFGFLASSWSLIAITIVSPILYFVYKPDLRVHDPSLDLDMVTLSATCLGMVVFGNIADRYGRSAWYGFELAIVLCSIGGAAFASDGLMVPTANQFGFSSSMDIYTALICWRFGLGLGIGAEYPMSAVIAAEFASTKWRATTLVLIFLAQPVGRLLAYGIGLGVIRGLSQGIDLSASDGTDVDMLRMDKVWRLVLALAGIPAIFAIGLRLFIPETPRFFSAVLRDMNKAKEVVTQISSRSPDLKVKNDIMEINGEQEEDAPKELEPWGRRAHWYFFGKSQGWKRLLAISVQWLLTDIVVYGTGLDNPGTLAALWLDKPPPASTNVPIWNADPAYPDESINDAVDRTLSRTLKLTSAVAVVGTLVALLLVNCLSRRMHYASTSLILSLFFAGTAISVSLTYATPSHLASMVFYALTQFMFNVGPNTITFLIAVEAFPTEFRGTCYGIAAAMGKIGAIIIRPVIASSGTEKDGLVKMFSVFAGITFLMALLAWFEPFGIALPKVHKDEKGPWRLIPGWKEDLSLEAISPWPLPDEASKGKEAVPQQENVGSPRVDENSGLLQDGESDGAEKGPVVHNAKFELPPPAMAGALDMGN